MNKRLFMIIAVMTIVAMAVVGLVACNNRDKVKAITETAGLNISNLAAELMNKTFTVSAIMKEVENGQTDISTTVTEYEPTKLKEMSNVDGKDITSYAYKLGDKFIYVDHNENVSIRRFNDSLSMIIQFIAPDAAEFFDFIDGKYSVKTDKYKDYAKKLTGEEDLDEDDLNFVKPIFESLRIEFKKDSISINFGKSTPEEEATVNFDITKIGATTVTIPQNILDLPVHGITIGRLNDLETMNYTANLKMEANGEITQDMVIKYYYDFGKSCLSSNLKGINDMIYVWENENKYYIAMQEDDIIKKKETDSADLQVVPDMIESIVGGYYSFFELIDGKYVVSENNIDDYIRNNDIDIMYQGDMDAARAYVKSISLSLGKEIVLTYTTVEYGVSLKTTLTICDFYTTTTSVPDSIINMPVTNPTI